MIYVFLATGFEDVEALGFVDICRRASLPLTTVSITGKDIVESAHGVGIAADALFEELIFEDADLLYLPGGMPGAANLGKHQELCQLIERHYASGKPLAAICAAPMVYGALGLLKGRSATCYPGFEKYLQGANVTPDLVVCDGPFFLGKGPAAVFELGYTIVSYFCGEDVANQLRAGMLYNEL